MGRAKLPLSLGRIHQEQNDLDEALAYSRQPEQIRQEQGPMNFLGVLQTSICIGAVLWPRKDLDLALEYYYRTLIPEQLSNASTGSIIANAYNKIYLVLECQAKYEKDLGYKMKALDIRLDIIPTTIEHILSTIRGVSRSKG